MQEAGRAPVGRKSRDPRVVAFFIAVGVVALDQVTKTIIAHNIPEGESRRFIGTIVWLSHFRNPGAAFGTLPGWGGVFALAAMVGIVVFAAIVFRHPPMLTALGAAFVAGGAAGNLTDRLFRAHGVIDFLDLRWWPAFNVADSAITVGAILLLLSGLFEKPKARDGDEQPSD